MGEAKCSKGWGARCAAARSKRCRCACGGANHGGADRRNEDGGGQTSPESVIYYRYDEDRVHSWTPRAGAIRAVSFSRHATEGERRGRAIVDVLYLDHAERLIQRYVRHSPDGFEFGYHGSGPADTALNLLAMFIPVKEATRDGLYHQFKARFVASVDQDTGGNIGGHDIREWITAMWKANDAAEAASEAGTA